MFTLRLILVAVITLSGLGGFAWFKISSNEKSALQAKLVAADLKAQSDELAFNQLEADIVMRDLAYEELYAEFSRSRASVIALEKRFTETKKSVGSRDIGKLAAQKPKSIERIINGATISAGRCIEILSGAELTDEEWNANTNGDINRECTTIANPNFTHE